MSLQTQIKYQDAFNHYRNCGWAFFSQVFDQKEISTLATACNQVQSWTRYYPQGYHEGSLRINPITAPDGSPYLTSAQWPGYRHKTFRQFRNHEKLGRIIIPIIGPDIKQVKSQIHWKPAQHQGIGSVRWHQDCQFRLPTDKFRNIGQTGVQAIIAIDPAGPDHGPLTIHPQSHGCGDLKLNNGTIDQQNIHEVLTHAGLSDNEMRAIEMQPGDVFIFSPYVIHGSGVNNADGERRIFINGYVSAAACDIGVWAWQNNQRCMLPQQPHPIEQDAQGEACHPHIPNYPQWHTTPMVEVEQMHE